MAGTVALLRSQKDNSRSTFGIGKRLYYPLSINYELLRQRRRDKRERKSQLSETIQHIVVFSKNKQQHFSNNCSNNTLRHFVSHFVYRNEIKQMKKMLYGFSLELSSTETKQKR